MKPLLLLLAPMLVLAGCKKVKENILERTALNMLDGTQWQITSFTDGPSNKSTDFNPYIFRFNKDLTVEAIRNNSTEAVGTWKGDVANRIIYANFPSASHPLPMLNATWTITKSTMESLTATTTAANQLRELKMEKR